MVSRAKLFHAWRYVLELSKLRDSESVVVLTKHDSDHRNIDAAVHAIDDLGAAILRLEPYLTDRPLRENSIAMEALCGANLVIDFLGLHILRSYEQQLVMEANTRILYVVEPPEALIRLLPSPQDKARVKAAAQCLKSGRKMRIESQAGTALTVQIGQYNVLSEYGYSDEPGHWDHWPAGFVATWPDEKTATGTVLIDRGDIIFPFKSYVGSPIRLEIEDGYIRNIEGSFDAEFLNEYMAQFRDDEAYAVSHLGWGLQPKASWTALGLLDKRQTNGNDARAFWGNFMFSTGPNTDGGGTRETLCHLDIPMRRCSIYVDDKPMVLEGEVVAEGQRICDT